MAYGLTGNWGKKSPTNGKIARKWLKNGILGPFLPFFGHFSARFPGEAIFAIFRPFLPDFGPTVAGQRDLNKA